MVSLADLLLPTPAKQQEQLTQLIAKQILNVMSSSKFSAAAAISQTATISASGTSRISDVSISQVANINTAVFLSDQSTIALKSDLKDALKNTIKNESAGLPFSGEPNVNTKISNIVDKSIEQSFTHDSMVSLNSAANQRADIVAVQSGQISNSSITQRADVITTFANQVGRDIATQLISTTSTEASTTTTTKNWLADTIGVTGNALSGIIGSTYTGLWSGPVLMFVALLAMIIVVAYILRSGSRAPATPPVAVKR